MPSQTRQGLAPAVQSPGVAPGPAAPGDNAFAQDQLRAGEHDKIARQLELLASALRQVGAKPLDRAHQERLATLRQQLSAAQGLLRGGDVAAASGLARSLDQEAGALVKDTGTVVDVAPTSGSGSGAFEGVSTLYVNGMSQSLTQSMEHSEALANIRGSEVGLVYNRSEGFGRDLGESVGQKLQHVVPGYEHRSREGETLAGAIDERLDAGRQVDVVTHSQGANFAKEAVQRLDDRKSDRERLDAGLHLTMMGAPLDSDELPGHFDNTTFLEEKDDPISNHLGRRDRDDKRRWWERLPVVGRDGAAGDERVVTFDDPQRGALTGAHDPSTYLSHPDAQAALSENPFQRR